MNSATKNLLFLLGAAPMGLGACAPTGDDTAEDETAGDGDGDGDPTGDGDGDGDGDPTTGDGDGDGDPTTGDGDGDPTTGDGDGDPTTGDGDGDGDPTTGDGDGDGDNQACQAFGDQYGECYGGPRYAEMAENYCNYDLAYYEVYGPDCIAAFEAYITCLSSIPCEEFLDDEDDCVAEAAVFDSVCQ